MVSRPNLRTLLAGVAVASLSTAAMAGEWSSYIVFGDRHLDSGQYVTRQAAIGDVGFNVGDGQLGLGDGRFRATNPLERRESIRGQVFTQMLADSLGLGAIDPSQPIAAADIPTPEDGFNYAALYFTSEDVLNSIVGTTSTLDTTYEQFDTTGTLTIPGRTRLGLLNDPDRRDEVKDAFIILGGGGEDIRRLADVDQDGITGRVATTTSRFELDAAQRDLEARNAANNIADGAAALVDAGSGLLVVTNTFNTGATPEVQGDQSLYARLRNSLLQRYTNAAQSENLAISREASALEFAEQARLNEVRRDTIADNLAIATSDPATSQSDITELQTQLGQAETTLDESQVLAQQWADFALEARAEANALALTDREIALDAELTAAQADENLAHDIRTAATDEFNATLLERVRDIEGNVILVDQHALIEAIIEDPARFGFAADVDQQNNCLINRLGSLCDQELRDFDELLFAGGNDLSTAGHAALSDQIAAMVQAPAALSGIPGVGLSSGRSIADASRDQLSREQSWKAGVSVFATGATSRIKLADNDGFAQSDAAFHSGVVGAKYTFANGIAVGAAGAYQLVKTPGSESSMNYSGDAMLGTVFAGINTGPVFGSVTATYGKINYDELNRVSKIGAARITNGSDTTGTVKGVTAEAGVRVVQYDILRAGPIANFSHWTSTVDGYSENGWKTTAVRTGDLESKSTRAGLGIFMEAGGIVDGFGTLFRAKALYGHEFQDNNKTASVTPLGDSSAGSFSTKVRGADDAPFELGGEVVFGYNGIITTFGYDGTFGDISDHRFRLGASLPLGG